MKVLAAVASLLLTLLACGGGSEQADLDNERIRASIIRLVDSDSSDSAFHSEIRLFYENREYQPAWVAADSLQRLRQLVELLCNADRDGLNRVDYVNAAVQRRIEAASPGATEIDSVQARALARLDITLTQTLLDFATDVLIGRVDPDEFGSEWNTPLQEVDVLSVITDTATGNVRLQDWHREDAEYVALRDMLRHYRRIQSKGGWPSVPTGEALEEGAAGPRVAALIERLAATGDVDSSLITASPDSARYSAAVAAGVERFQRRHGIRADGIAGETVLQRMNVPVGERIRQIELNLERWRWIPSHLGSRYVYVNVPAYELHAFDGGREVLSMAVVVGEQYNDRATPVFSDTMEYVVFNPYWNVPESIASEEILPKARDDRGYLQRNDYEIVDGWSESADVIDPYSANLDLVESGAHRIRQKPGRQNALGRIKFMFPNEFDIYLHDTPEEHLFDRPQRAYSHGCIRVQHPVEFAEYVFTSEEWTADRIRDRIESEERSTESLQSPLPVYILYWTAFVDQDGLVNFREDIYGNDAALDEALKSQRPASDAVSCDSLLASLPE